jgi:hypothetical protein
MCYTCVTPGAQWSSNVLHLCHSWCTMEQQRVTLVSLLVHNGAATCYTYVTPGAQWSSDVLHLCHS